MNTKRFLSIPLALLIVLAEAASAASAITMETNRLNGFWACVAYLEEK